MAKNRDVFAKAFKSQPDALSELLTAPVEVAPVVEPVESAEVEAPAAKPAKAPKAAK
jgi:hypothetical protein